MRLPPEPRWAQLSACCAFAVLCAVTLANAAAPERAAPDWSVVIQGLEQPAENVRLSDFNGRDVTAELKLRNDGARLAVALPRLDQFIVKPRAVETLALPQDGRAVLPGGIVVPLVSSADDSQQASSAWFRLTLAASPSPATWDENASAYVTKLTFGLRRPPQIPEAIRLSQPVLVKLAYEGITADELPPLTIEAAGLQYEKTVELRFRPQTPAPRLLVRSTLSDVDVALEALGRLELRPQQRAMLGYGLESVEIAVENVRPHGEPMAVERKTPLAIESDARARVETADVNFEAGAARTVFRVRSAGAGPVTFMATAAGIRGQTTVQQEFPLAPLAGAVLGGALGGFSRRFVKGARRKQAARRIGEGIVVATVAFVAAVLGVGYLNLPAAVAATEAGAFLVGALAGFAGVTVLETVGKKTANA